MGDVWTWGKVWIYVYDDMCMDDVWIMYDDVYDNAYDDVDFCMNDECMMCG